MYSITNAYIQQSLVLEGYLYSATIATIAIALATTTYADYDDDDDDDDDDEDDDDDGHSAIPNIGIYIYIYILLRLHIITTPKSILQQILVSALCGTITTPAIYHPLRLVAVRPHHRHRSENPDCHRHHRHCPHYRCLRRHRHRTWARMLWRQLQASSKRRC